MYDVSEFSTRAGANVPSTIAAVGTERGAWGSAVTVTVRRGSGSPASTMLRMNRSIGPPRTHQTPNESGCGGAALENGGGADGVGHVVCHLGHGRSTRTMTLSAQTPRSRARRSFSRTHRSW